MSRRVQAHLSEGIAHHRSGRLEAAGRAYERARGLAPHTFDAWHLGGLVAYQLNRHTEASVLLGRALQLKPASAVCQLRAGLVCSALGDLRSAESHFSTAVNLDPALAEGWSHLGQALRSLGRRVEARAAYERAIALESDYAEAHERLGALISATEGFAAAVPHFRTAAALAPKSATAWANLGVALVQSAGVAEAQACFDRALALEPTHVLARTGRALAWQEGHEPAKAVDAYAGVLALQPHHHEARSGRLLALHYLDGISREELLAEHIAFGKLFPDVPARRFPNPADPRRRLRVAFLSPDLRAHSVAYFLEPLLAHLDPRQFEVVLYHDHPRMDMVSQRLRAHAAIWRHFAGCSQTEVEAAIRADAPDLLIDLAGHTGLNRLPLLARRLAPVQATYLGYPDTTGLRTIDYRLVDAITDPAEADSFHTEQLLRFAPTAWTYLPPADAPEPSRSPPRAVNAVTFGCFNNPAKVNDRTLRGWARVLSAVPDSRLLLKGHGLAEPAAAARIRTRFAALGVADHRIELAGRTPGVAAHLARYDQVDVALDTFPYHGTTTTCEALWMGVPVVSLIGDSHMARVGASLLSAAQHPEWIARDWDDYVRIAAQLAADPARRAALRSGLRDDLRHGPLLDHAGQARRFGEGLRAGWKQWCATQPPVTESA